MKNFILPLLILSFFGSFWEKGKVETPKEQLQQSLEQGSVVFIDVSKSMRGYFRTKSSNMQANALQQFLQSEFRNTISENNLKPLYLAKFASEVAQPEEVQDDIGNIFVFESDDEIKEFFSGGSTNLVEVFRSEGFDKYTVSIIVTDGLQSGLGGFDIGEMIRVVRTKIDDGLHIYLIGIMSGFEGLIFPGLPGRTERFWHKGLKPIYIWIATRDSKIGGNITKYLVSRIKKYWDGHAKPICITNTQLPNVSNIELDANSPEDYIVIPGKDNIEVTLASSLKNKKIDKINIPIKMTSNLDDISKYWELSMRLEPEVDWANIVREASEKLEKPPAEVEFPEDLKNKISYDESRQLLVFKGVMSEEEKKELLKLSTNDQYQQAIKALFQSALKKNEEGWFLSLTYTKIPKGTFFRPGGGEFKFKVIAIPDEQQYWWRQWSTDDDSIKESADKTLYLGRLGKQIIELLYNKKHELKSLDIKIVKL